MLAPSAHSKSVLSYCHRLASTKPKRTTLATQLSVSVCSVTRDFNEQPHLHESERVLFRHNTMSALSQHVVGMAAVRPARSMISLLRSQQAGCSCSAPTSQLASLPVPRRVRSQKASRQQRPAALEQSTSHPQRSTAVHLEVPDCNTLQLSYLQSWRCNLDQQLQVLLAPH